MAKKDMLMVALGKGPKPEDEMDDSDGLEYGADGDEDEGTEDEPMDHESAVADDLVDAGFSQEKADALVDAIKALIETKA